VPSASARARASGGLVTRSGQRLALDGPVRLGVEQVAELEPADAFEDDLIVAVAGAADLPYAGVGADRLQIRELRVDHAGVALDGDAKDRLAGLEGLDQGDRAGAADGHGDDRAREEDAVAQRQ
jgi:hypothetical protein